MASLLKAGAFGSLVFSALGQWPLHLRQVLEGQTATDATKCEGEPIKSETMPLGKCAPYMTFASTVATCNGSSLELTFFNGTACKGQATSSLAMPVGQCFKSVLTRGLSVTISCNGGNYTEVSWSSAPLAPRGAFCDYQGAAEAAAGALSVRSSEVNESLTDEVSFEVSLPPLGRPFLSFTAPVGRDGVARAVIPGLRPSTKYTVSARAHRRGKQEGDPEAWSVLSAVKATCVSAGEEAASSRIVNPGATPAKPKVATRWLEVYRFASNAQLPDFLDEHNAGDLVGEFALGWSMSGAKGMPITRYCVEALDTLLPNITTGSVDGEPIQSPFANFASCMQGQCMCAHQVDRSIGHLPAKQIQDMCSGPPVGWANNTCRCSEQSLEQSSRHVGRLVIPLPMVSEGSLIRPPLKIPSDYPRPVRSSPTGYWYSFPYLGRCPPGAAVGDQGCTWRRLPSSHTVYGDELTGIDGNMSIDTRTMRSEVGFEAVLTNVLAGDQAFRRLPVDVPACGERAGLELGGRPGRAPRQIVV